MPASEHEQAERAGRVREIADLIAKGLSQPEIERWVKEKRPEWAVTSRAVRYYVADAKLLLSDEAKSVDRAAEFALAKMRNDLLFNAAYKIQDYKTALAANVQNIRLMRLDAPNTDFDWKKAAEAAGIKPDDVIRQFVESLDMEGMADEQ